MALGDIVEIVGLLNERDGRWSLRPDGGGEWRLDIGWMRRRGFRELLGRRTRLIGVRDGFDLLAVRSVVAADAPVA